MNRRNFLLIDTDPSSDLVCCLRLVCTHVANPPRFGITNGTSSNYNQLRVLAIALIAVSSIGASFATNSSIC